MENDAILIDFEPVGKRVFVRVGCTILSAAEQGGIEMVSICGGMGTCLHCRVQVMSGSLSPVNATEKALFSKQEIISGFRLACQAILLSSAKIHIPPDSLTTPQRLQLEGLEENDSKQTSFKISRLQLEVPFIGDLRSDANRMVAALGLPVNATHFRYPIMKTLSDEIRKLNWKIHVAHHGNEIMGLLREGEKALGLAVDIGTTKVAAYLLDLVSGEILGRNSAMNPQIQYGEDVISRIHYSMKNPDGRSTLQKKIVETIQELATSMCANLVLSPQQIFETVAVGNTTMHHFFAGLPVSQLGLSPYVPAVSESISFDAAEIGLQFAPGSRVYLPANIAGYVGSDHVAMLLATETYTANDTLIALDIGTNTEISLHHKGKIFCCSCASGPAFEGAHIHEGMRASSGAIERIRIDGETIHFHTINKVSPIGICGSGILDALGEMVRNHIMDERGNLNISSPMVQENGKDTEFILVPEAKTSLGHAITINRKDISEIMLAKAAIQSGIEILLKTAGVTKDHLDRFLVAGAFGTYLDIKQAVQIGMFPDLPIDRYHQVGNAAGAGARQILVSDEKRSLAEEIARKVVYVELTTYPYFNDVYLNALRFQIY